MKKKRSHILFSTSIFLILQLASASRAEEARSSSDRSLKQKEEEHLDAAPSSDPAQSQQTESSLPLESSSEAVESGEEISTPLQVPLMGITEDSVESKAEAIARALQEALSKLDVSHDSLEQMNYDQLLQYTRQLRDALVLANAEAEFFRTQWQQLRLANEAMGIDILTGDEKALQQRLVQAVRELYNTERERREAIQTLKEISDASSRLIRSGSGYNPQFRAQYEEAYRSAQKLLEGKGNTPVPIAQSLEDAQIVSINHDLKTVVINVGARHGIKVGMPFRVLRKDKVIGSIKILQTREMISAAVIEQVQGEQIFQIKDRVVLATTIREENKKLQR